MDRPPAPDSPTPAYPPGYPAAYPPGYPPAYPPGYPTPVASTPTAAAPVPAAAKPSALRMGLPAYILYRWGPKNPIARFIVEMILLFIFLGAIAITVRLAQG